LCTFSLDSDPSRVPLYDHDNLGESFGALDRHIRNHLDDVVPTNCITVRLSAADPATLDERNAEGLTAAAFHVASVPDERCYGNSMWVLGVRAKMRSTDLVASVPRLVKLCSREDIVKLVKRALPGTSLEHLKAPPAEISPGLGVEYFRIDRSGPAWEVVSKRRSVGVYVPQSIEGAELELSVVLEI
jgi:type VI secretion system protein ImpJ